MFASTLKYDPGAAIAAMDPHRVFTVTNANKLAVTNFNTETGYWGPTTELIPQIPGAPVTAIRHPKPHDSEFTEAVYCQKKAGEITKVRFAYNGSQDESTLPVTL